MLDDIQDQLEERLDEIMNAPEHKHRWQIVDDVFVGYEGLLIFACFGCEMVLYTNRQHVRDVVSGCVPAIYTAYEEAKYLMGMDMVVRINTHNGSSVIVFKVRDFYILQIFTDPKEK